METRENKENLVNIEKQFQFSGELTKRKLVEYLPAMLITNLSALLLVSVDGIVVGNMVSAEALSSVNIFYPATLIISIISTLVASGASARLSEAMGKIDLKGLLKIRSSLNTLMIVAAVFVAIIQIPIVMIIIASYGLSPEIKDMVWKYAIGVMISMPFGLISTVGVLQLQVVGKMKVLMTLSCIEGAVNLLLDLLFVGPLHMGIAGAGYGTAGANIIRCTLTVLYLWKKTDMYYTGGEKPAISEIKTLLFRGLPEAANGLMLGVQNYAIVAIVLTAFGESGGAIKGVVSFVISVSLVLTNGVQGAIRPMTGLLSGADALKGLRTLMRQGIFAVTMLNAALMAVVEIFPGLFYTIHGVKTVPDGGLASLRFAALEIIFLGINTLFRLYFTNRKIVRFSTILALVGNATLPLFAFLFSKLTPPVWLWLAYLLTQTVILVANLIRYSRMQVQDREAVRKDETDLYLTVSQENVIEASRELRRYAEEAGINRKFAFRTALCMEEMAAYAQKSHKTDKVNIQIMIRFFSDSAMLMIIDDGACIFLDKEEEKQKIITTNYGLLKKISKSVEYQYVLNLNYTVCRY